MSFPKVKSIPRARQFSGGAGLPRAPRWRRRVGATAVDRLRDELRRPESDLRLHALDRGIKSLA